MTGNDPIGGNTTTRLFSRQSTLGLAGVRGEGGGGWEVRGKEGSGGRGWEVLAHGRFTHVTKRVQLHGVVVLFDVECELRGNGGDY